MRFLDVFDDFGRWFPDLSPYLLYTPTSQDNRWAKINRRTQQPLDPRCFTCVMAVGKGFPHMEWQTVVARSKTDSFFKDVVLGALSVYRGATKQYHPEIVAEQSTRALVLERKLLFLSEEEFAQKFGVKVSQVSGVQIHSYINEQGIPTNGIICVDPAKPYRRLKLSHQLSLEHSTTLMKDSDHLRKDQGADLFNFYGPLWARNNNAVTQGNGIPSFADLTRMAEEAKARLSGNGPAEAEPAAPVEQPPLANVEIIPDEVEEAFVGPTLPTAKGKGKSKGGKGKSKGNSQLQPPASTGAGSKRRRSAGSTVAGSVLGTQDEDIGGTQSIDGRSRAMSVAGESDARGRSRSPVLSSRGLIPSPADKCSSKLEHHMRQLSVPKILDGVNLGREIYQATRALEALEKSSPGSSESVSLRARLKLVKNAQDITAEKLFTMKAKGSNREQLLERVLTQLREKLPPKWSAALLTSQVKDTFITSEDAVAKVISMLSPSAPDAGELS